MLQGGYWSGVTPVMGYAWTHGRVNEEHAVRHVVARTPGVPPMQHAALHVSAMHREACEGGVGLAEACSMGGLALMHRRCMDTGHGPRARAWTQGMRMRRLASGLHGKCAVDLHCMHVEDAKAPPSPLSRQGPVATGVPTRSLAPPWLTS